MSEQDTQAFLSWLKTQIPLLNHMGLGELTFEQDALTLHAALAPNINDKGTGFGGSLATLATITGWSWVTLLLRRQDLACDVVIRDSSLTYLAPITGDFYATARVADGADIDAFLARLAEKGRARLALQVEVCQEGQVALTMQGNYVALKNRTGKPH